MTRIAIVVMCAALMCGPQEFRDISQAPFVIDANEIAVDPASGQRLCLGWAAVEVGTTFSRTAMYCDPDGDPLVFTPQPYLTVDEPNGTYTLLWPCGAVHRAPVTRRIVCGHSRPRTESPAQPPSHAGTFAATPAVVPIHRVVHMQSS